MAYIENVRTAQPAQVERDMRTIDDATLLGQELVQKGAIHALSELKAMGVTPENVTSMLASLETMGRIVSAECERRKIGAVDLKLTPQEAPVQLRSVEITPQRIAQMIEYHRGVLVELMTAKFGDDEIEGVANAVVETNDTIAALERLDRLTCDTPPDVASAIAIARLWRSGKMIGGDADEVRNKLLGELDRLRGEA